MEFKWFTKKYTWDDVKKKDNIIDQGEIDYDFDLANGEYLLSESIGKRIKYAKTTGSRVQKNSIVMYSNKITIPIDRLNGWDDDTKKYYFKVCFHYFQVRFGTENVISAKVYLREENPYMLLYFVPFNPESGKLQARISMNRKSINDIHNELPKHLRGHGFDVERAKRFVGNLDNNMRSELDAIPDDFLGVPYVKMETEKVKKGLIKHEEYKTGNYILSKEQYECVEEIIQAAILLKKFLLKEK